MCECYNNVLIELLLLLLSLLLSYVSYFILKMHKNGAADE